MKILALCSSLDLRLPYSCTPAWWQLLEALSQAGADLVVTPYTGEVIDSPWWRSYENPCKREGALFARAKRVMSRVGIQEPGRAAPDHETTVDLMTRYLAHAWVRPKWERHLRRIFEREGSFDAVLVLTVPLNHISGLPSELSRRYGVPFFYYDGDVPASLPRFAGFQSGFKIYQGADLSEYQAFISNSRAGADELVAMGARAAHTLYFGADPQLFTPMRIEQDLDVFFYGHGAEYRESWIKTMLANPSERLPELQFAVRGSRFGIEMPNVERLPYLSLAKLREYCCRSKINLLITRSTHASVFASSTCRPFELAALESCMVSNPYSGIEEWFEPDKEVVIVNSEEEAVERYRWLIENPNERCRIAAAARRRLLADHTYEQRALQLIEIMSGRASTQGSAPLAS